MFSCFSAQRNKREASLKSIRLNSDEVTILGSDGAVPFSVGDIKEATRNFSPSRKIGQGGFGTVYYGKLQDGTTVAVKRAKKDFFEKQSCAEFWRELNMLSRVEHLNLVRLYGYFDTHNDRALVFEYVPNGNLREHLDGRRPALSFRARVDILIDVAHALAYLHHYAADYSIIHRDVKASNILLTNTLRAKVTDFGFSRVGSMDLDATHVSTEVKGTAGYLDPEYLCTQRLTTKSDVYSFGILVLEVLSGRHPIEAHRSGEERITVRWAWKKFDENESLSILDPGLEKLPEMADIVDRLVEVALQCASPSRKERPSMQDVTQLLCKIRKDLAASIHPN